MRTFDFWGDNIPGISLMYAIPVAALVRLDRNPVNGQTAMLLTGLDDIIDIPVLAGDSFQVSEIHSLADGGELWDISISGFIPKRYQLSENTIRTLEQGDWFTMVRDANGVITLFGSSDIPLKFSHSRNTGNSTERNGSRFIMKAKQSQPSVILNALPSVG